MLKKYKKYKKETKFLKYYETVNAALKLLLTTLLNISITTQCNNTKRCPNQIFHDLFDNFLKSINHFDQILYSQKKYSNINEIR